MAGKFMRVKRMVLPFITLVFLASQLAGCAALNSQEFLAEASKTDEIVIEYNELEESESPEQSRGIEGYITQSSQSEGEDDSIGVINTSSKDEAQEISATDLYTIFEQGYQGGQIYAEFGLSEEELILMEVAEVESILSVRTDIKAPADLESQYRAWRAEAHPATSTQAPPQETQSSTGGQQSKPVGGTQQTGVGGGSTTHTPPPKVTNQGSGNDNSGDITGWQDTGGPEIDDSKTQSTTDAGYLPEDPNDYIYGN